MKRVDTVELDFIKCTTIIPPRAWGTGEYTPPPAKAVSMVFGVHGGHVATCQSGSRLCVDYPLICCCCLSHLHGLQGPAACAGLSNDRTRSPTRHPRRKGRPTRPLIDSHGPIAPSSSGPATLPDKRRVTDSLGHRVGFSGVNIASQGLGGWWWLMCCG